MKKLLIIIFSLFTMAGFSQVQYPFDMQISGDLQIDSTLHISQLLFSSSDSILVMSNDSIYYTLASTLFAADTSKQSTTGIENIYGVQKYRNYQTTDSSGKIINGSDTLVDANAVFDAIQVKETTSRWSPYEIKLTWTGGTPTVTYDTAYFMMSDSTVYFHIYLHINNNSGNTLTNLEINLPISPPQNTIWVPVECRFGESVPESDFSAYIDMRNATSANRNIKHNTFSIPNGTTFYLIYTGFYMIQTN